MAKLHSRLASSHSEVQATYKRISLYFFWHELKENIRQWVRNCESCQQNKIENVPYRGLLQSLPISEQAWADISMDFIRSVKV